MRFVSAAVAQQIDSELMGPSVGFSIHQLMELAGLSCAHAIADALPVSKYRRCLCICGPGNNGGDGLVCARHLKLMGYEPTILYPKEGKDRELFGGLIQQNRALGVTCCPQPQERAVTTATDSWIDRPLEDIPARYDFIIDAIFGFGFKGDVRAPFDRILEALLHQQTRTQAQAHTCPPLVSIDVPSGWTVDDEHAATASAPGTSIHPQILISLTAPKPCARNFGGRHYLGGRFLPESVARRYSVDIPDFPGTSQFVRLS